MRFDRDLATTVINGGSFDPQEVIDNVLVPCSDEYYNGDSESPLSDSAYDFISNAVKQVVPTHSFFTGVGAETRGGKIPLPFPMGSLDQVQQGELEEWKRKLNLKNTDVVVVTAKLDGASAAAIFNKGGDLRIAFSRGNGFEGADITRHIKHTAGDLCGGLFRKDGIAVRAESIIAKQAFVDNIQPIVKRADGKQYANPRNAVSGMMNASITDDRAYPHIDFVAYQRLDDDSISKEEQLIQLQMMGFEIPWYTTTTVAELTEAYLSDIIQQLRRDYKYEIDGVVVELDDPTTRARLKSDGLNPGYAMKYKTLDASNYVETTVVAVEWNPSKTRYAKPRVIVEPCSLPGITCTYATGYNAKYIVDNKIGPGARVGISRMGEVVPNIVAVIEGTEAQLPDFPCEWNETGVDLVCSDESMLDTILVAQLTDVARSLDVDGLREGTARTIIDNGNYSSFNEVFSAILSWPRKWWVELIGSNGGKIHDDLHLKLQGIQLADWLGSMPHFGRGVGKRKMRALLSSLNITELAQFNALTARKIRSVEGFKDKTAYKVLAGIDDHMALWDKVAPLVHFGQKNEAVESNLSGHKVVLTGFRDGALEKQIEAAGGEVQSSVSSKTTIVVALVVDGASSKLKKAADINAAGKGHIEIMTLNDFKAKYINTPSNAIEF